MSGHRNQTDRNQPEESNSTNSSPHNVPEVEEDSDDEFFNGRSPGIIVQVQINNERFRIPCGTGEQDIRWLAAVAAQRYALAHQPQGQSRQREQRQNATIGACKAQWVRHRMAEKFGSDMVGPSLTVKSVVAELEKRAKEQDQIISQQSRRLSVFSDNDANPTAQGVSLIDKCTLEIDLDTEVELNPDNSRKQTLWSALSFNFTPAARRRAAIMRERYKESLVSNSEIELRGQESALKHAKERLLNLLTIDDLDDEYSVKKALNEDWPFIRIDLVSDHSEDTRGLRDWVLHHFSELAELFNHYAGWNKLGLVSMLLGEFKHFIALAQILNISKDTNAIATLFTKAQRTKDTLDQRLIGFQSLDIFEFINVILLLSKYKYGRERHRDGTSLTGVERISKLWDLHLHRVHTIITTGEMRQTMKIVEMEKFICKHLDALHVVFDYYVTEVNDPARAGIKKDSGLMDFEQFCVVFGHSGLVSLDVGSATRGPMGLRSRGAGFQVTILRDVFAAVQREDEQLNGTASPDTGSRQHRLDDIVFGEFIEAIMRVAYIVWRKENASSTVKYKRGVRAVAVLALHLGRPRDQLGLQALEFDSSELSDISNNSSTIHNRNEADSSGGVGGIFHMTEQTEEGTTPRQSPHEEFAWLTGSRYEINEARKASLRWIDEYKKKRFGLESPPIDFGIGAEKGRRSAFTAVADIIRGNLNTTPIPVTKRYDAARKARENEPLPVVSRVGSADVATRTRSAASRPRSKRAQTSFQTSHALVLPGGGLTSSSAELPEDGFVSTDDAVDGADKILATAPKSQSGTSNKSKLPKAYKIHNRLMRRYVDRNPTGGAATSIPSW